MTETEENQKAPEQAAPVRRITLGFVIGWAWAIFAGVGSLVMILSGENVAAGLVIFPSALIALPPFGTLLKTRLNIALSGWLKTAVVIVLLVVSGAYVKPENKSGAATVSSDTSSSTQSEASETAPQKPSLAADQAQFGAANETGKNDYAQMDNDLKRSVVRKRRDLAAMSATSGGSFEDWTGTLDEMTTNGDGDAVVSVQLDGCPCKLKTWNNSLSDIGSGTLIKNGSALFNRIMNMSVGQKVRISGTILKESSMTEEGSVTDPEWIVKFSDISPN